MKHTNDNERVCADETFNINKKQVQQLPWSMIRCKHADDDIGLVEISWYIRRW